MNPCPSCGFHGHSEPSTRRERIATAVLAGIHASPKTFAMNGKAYDPKDDAGSFYARIAVSCADALISELNRTAGGVE